MARSKSGVIGAPSFVCNRSTLLRMQMATNFCLAGPGTAASPVGRNGRHSERGSERNAIVPRRFAGKHGVMKQICLDLNIAK